MFFEVFGGILAFIMIGGQLRVDKKAVRECKEKKSNPVQ